MAIAVESIFFNQSLIAVKEHTVVKRCDGKSNENVVNKRVSEQNNGYTHALYKNFVNFLAVILKRQT